MSAAFEWVRSSVVLLGLAVGAHGLPPRLQPAPSLEVRFCPAGPLWSYPQDVVHGVQSLLLQNAVVINHGTPVTITSVDVALLEKGEVRDVRHLTSADIAGLGAAASQITPLLQLVPFQFCGHAMLPAGVTLAGPTLSAGHALILLQEPFAFTGARDSLRITAHASAEGRDIAVSNEVGIIRRFPPGANTFPLHGVWYIANSPSFHTAHRWGVSEEFAFDILKLDARGQSHAGTGSRFEDYYAYNTPVQAIASGRVVGAVNDEPEDPRAMIRMGETKSAYMVRLQLEQGARIGRGLRGLMGDYVVIDQGHGQFALYAHLRPGSVTVQRGAVVAQGQTIGRLGSSGNSTEPHLHIQLCDGPDPMMCDGMPLRFVDITLPQADAPRPLQTGDVVVAP